jgi:hypothetical protein
MNGPVSGLPAIRRNPRICLAGFDWRHGDWAVFQDGSGASGVYGNQSSKRSSIQVNERVGNALGTRWSALGAHWERIGLKFPLQTRETSYHDP